MADIVVAATLLWVRWVLRRIEPLILGQPTALIRDLRDGLTFYRGDLTERLRASGLASLEPTVQQTIGSAVAERAMRGTTDFFTKLDSDPWAAAFEKSMTESGIAWYLNTIQYEPDTGFRHYEWVWEVLS